MKVITSRQGNLAAVRDMITERRQQQGGPAPTSNAGN